MRHTRSLRTALTVLLCIRAACAGLGADAGARERPPVATEADIIERLRREAAAATDEVERAILSERIAYHQAHAAQERGGMLRAIGKLKSIGAEHAGEHTGAKALVRAAEYCSELGDFAGARALFEEAGERFRANPHWPGSQSSAVDCGIRVGDTFRYEGEFVKAVGTWQAVFREFSGVALAAQLPEKIRLLQHEFMGPEEAWAASVAFFEEAIERSPGADWLDRFELERFYALRDGLSVIVDGKPVSLISRERLLEELDALLAKYPPGASRLIDLQRHTLLAIRENLVPKSAAAKARSDLQAITEMEVPDIGLDEMAAPQPALEESEDANGTLAGSGLSASTDGIAAAVDAGDRRARGTRLWPAAVAAATFACGGVIIWLAARARGRRAR